MIIVNKRSVIISRVVFLLLLSIAITNYAKAHKILANRKDVTTDPAIIKRVMTNKTCTARLCHGITHDGVYFTASGKHGKSYQLFLFNMDGKLIKQSRIVEKQTVVLTKIEKGDYLFEVFSDDVRIENGRIAIK